jgi:lipoprotein-anchoring transpeptidase ErfK/SrfK
MKTARETRRLGWTLGLVFALASSTLAQVASVAAVDGRDRSIRPPRQVVVSVPDRKLAVIENGTILRVFPVAVGAVESPSPIGVFPIVQQLSHPTYYHPGTVIPPGKNNPLGPRWLGLNKKGFGIHGTNAPNSVGKAASHGCIRLRNRDVVELYAMLSVGDVVEIRAERDMETARIFGDGNTHAEIVAQAGVIVGSAGGQ